MSSITAVVLSRNSYQRKWPGLEVLVHRAIIHSARDQQEARYQAALRVRTSHWFWLDDDDDLPPDYLEVLEECLRLEKPLVYTDELVRSDSLGKSHNRAGIYSQEAHYRNPLLVHHLALYQTLASHEAIRALPKGHYWPEMPLAWLVAKLGVGQVPRVGYVWNQRAGQGMHSWSATQLAIMRAKLWCKANP